MNREKFLIVHGVDPARWAQRYEIQPVTRPCRVCGNPLATSVPFAHGTLRGLLAPTCACGNARTPYCVVRDSRYGDLFTASDKDGSPRAKAAQRSESRVLRLQPRVCSPDE